MYCPRCGSPNTDTIKFCRQCGLALQQVTGYVASGGTGALTPPPQTSLNPIAKATDGFTPKQKMILTILLLVFSPAIFGTFGAVTGLEEFGAALAGISAVLMPIGIVFTVMRYKAQKQRLAQAQMQYAPMPPGQMQPQMPYQSVVPPSAVPQYSLPQPIQQPIAPPQNYQQPIYQPPSPPPTNPLQRPSSVVEDETRRLPGQG